MSDSITCTTCKKLYVGSQCPECGHIEDTGSLSLDQINSDENSVAIDAVELEQNQAALVVIRGATIGETLILEGDVITVGRDAGCDLFLDDITVSRKHAEIQSAHRSEGVVWTVLDTASLNGTYLNRELISQKAFLVSGDELQFGKFKFTFLLPGGN